MFFSLFFMTKAIVIVFSLKCKSKKSIFERFHLRVDCLYDENRDSERFTETFENFDVI